MEIVSLYNFTAFLQVKDFGFAFDSQGVFTFGGLVSWGAVSMELFEQLSQRNAIIWIRELMEGAAKTVE